MCMKFLMMLFGSLYFSLTNLGLSKNNQLHEFQGCMLIKIINLVLVLIEVVDGGSETVVCAESVVKDVVCVVNISNH